MVNARCYRACQLVEFITKLKKTDKTKLKLFDFVQNGSKEQKWSLN